MELISKERLLLDLAAEAKSQTVADKEKWDRLIREMEAVFYKTLSERDRRFLKEGLHQSNQAGAERYAREILHRAIDENLIRGVKQQTG